VQRASQLRRRLHPHRPSSSLELPHTSWNAKSSICPIRVRRPHQGTQLDALGGCCAFVGLAAQPRLLCCLEMPGFPNARTRGQSLRLVQSPPLRHPPGKPQLHIFSGDREIPPAAPVIRCTPLPLGEESLDVRPNTSCPHSKGVSRRLSDRRVIWGCRTYP
jgi:hypothetical protein